jgi:hypothetical protein
MFANQDTFTIEEVNLMCIFDTSSRAALMAELSAATPEFDEPELVEIGESALARLRGLADTEFDALTLYPEYGDYDAEQEV